MHKAKALNPIMLGRPVQAFEQLAAELAQRVQTHMHGTGHRAVAIALAQPRFMPYTGAAPATTEVVMQRATVQAHMAARYGFTMEDTGPALLAVEPAGADSGDAPMEAPVLCAPPAAPISSTEQRIGAALHEAVQAAAQALCAHAQAVVGAAATTPTSTWQWQADIQVAGSGWQPLLVTLDAASGHALEQYASRLRHAQRQSPPSAPVVSVPVHVDVTAQLLEKTVCAADIQNLRPGSILPIALGRTTVLLNGQALLAASVAEHQGKLHLTAFETLE